MKWTQLIDPANHLGLSALIASVPILFIFWALIIKKMKGYMASALTLLIAFFLAAVVYGMPIKTALLSSFHGILYGLFPICWIIIGAVFLYNITVKSGQFEIIKNFMAGITSDRRLQALLIAFSFGAFLEGAAGMGAPVAITAAMLVGLGFNPLYAAGLCLVANTAPVAFGAVGTPIIIAAHVTDIPEITISQMVGRTLPLLSVVVPFYLVVLMSGFRRSLEVMPAILVSGISFALFQWLCANFMGPMLPDVIAGIASILSLMLLLRFWKPKTDWKFAEEVKETQVKLKYPASQVIRAWSPFIVMTVMILAWGMAPVKYTLNALGNAMFHMPGLNGSILSQDGTPLSIKPFELNFLSSPGTALFLAGIISVPLIGLSYKSAMKTYAATLIQLKYPIITIVSVVGFAFLSNYSGMSTTMAMALASTGVLFPFFSPVLGWLGVFLTGSDTSSNALFCKLQQTTAEAIGVDPVVTVAANASGGVTGKMISPQSIAIGAAAVGLVGKESQLFRFTVKHSFIMLFVVCLTTLAQAYAIQWIIPAQVKSAIVPEAADSRLLLGSIYLGMLAVIVCLLIIFIIYNNRKNKAPLPVSIPS